MKPSTSRSTRISWRGSERWAPFLDFLSVEGPSALRDLSGALGNTTHGLAELWMATDPLNDSFSQWLVQATADFDRWAQGLDQTQGFQEFIEYVQTNGPRVAETAGAIGNALVQVAQAIAPLGGPSLQIIETLADTLALIANTPAGTVILGVAAAMSTLNLSVRALDALSKATFSGPGVERIRRMGTELNGVGLAAGRTSGKFAQIGKSAVGIFAVGTAVGAIADGIGRIDAEKLDRALTALAFTGEATDDIKQAVDNIGDVTSKLNAIDLGEVVTGFGLFGDSSMDRARDNIDQLDQKLASLVETGRAAQASLIFDRLKELADSRGIDPSKVTEQMDDYALALSNVAAGATGAADGVEEFGNAGDRTRAQTQGIIDAARAQAKEFLTLGDSVDDAKVSLDQWVNQLREQAIALEQFTANARKAGERGIRQGLIDQLEELGPVGALRMKQLANATDAEIARANKAFGRGIRAMDGWERYKLTRKQLQIENRQALAAIAEVRQQLRGLGVPGFEVPSPKVGKGGDGPSALVGMSSGGYTGPGGKYEPAGIVHKREFVFSSEATNGNEAMLDGLHKHLRGYASGGMVGGLPPWASGALASSGFLVDDKFPRTLKQWEQAVDRSKKAVERETKVRDDLQSKMDEVSSSFDRFRSELFGRETGYNRSDDGLPEGISAEDRARFHAFNEQALKQDPVRNAQLRIGSDIAQGRELQAAINQLKQKGFSGDALAALLSEGSLAEIQAYAGASRGELSELSRSYEQRERVLGDAGAAGADAAYGRALRGSERRLDRVIANGEKLEKRMEKVEKHLERIDSSGPERTGRAVGKEINSTARNARERSDRG